MAVTHTGEEMSPLHYLALVREADGLEIPDLRALFDAGVTGDETKLFMRVRIHPDGRLVAEPCVRQLDMSLPWAIGDDILILELSDFQTRDGYAILVELSYCPETQDLIEGYSTARAVKYSTARAVKVPELMGPSGPVTDLDLIWTSLRDEEARSVLVQTVVEIVDQMIQELGER
jgi:hypothetical protein